MTVLVVLREAEKSVGRRDDVLNSRTRAGLEERDGVNEDRRIRDHLRGHLQFSQCRAGLDAGLQDDASFDLCTRGQAREIVVRLGGLELRTGRWRHMSPASTRHGQYVDDLSFRRHITPAGPSSETVCRGPRRRFLSPRQKCPRPPLRPSGYHFAPFSHFPRHNSRQLAATPRRVAASGQLVDPVGVGLAPATRSKHPQNECDRAVTGGLAEAPRRCSGRRRIGLSRRSLGGRGFESYLRGQSSQQPTRKSWKNLTAFHRIALNHRKRCHLLNTAHGCAAGPRGRRTDWHATFGSGSVSAASAVCSEARTVALRADPIRARTSRAGPRRAVPELTPHMSSTAGGFRTTW